MPNDQFPISRTPAQIVRDLRTHEITLMHEAATLIETLLSELSAINPAIKCRSGCEVVKSNWPDERGSKC